MGYSVKLKSMGIFKKGAHLITLKKKVDEKALCINLELEIEGLIFIC